MSGEARRPALTLAQRLRAATVGIRARFGEASDLASLVDEGASALEAAERDAREAMGEPPDTPDPVARLARNYRTALSNAQAIHERAEAAEGERDEARKSALAHQVSEELLEARAEQAERDRDRFADSVVETTRQAGEYRARAERAEAQLRESENERDYLLDKLAHSAAVMIEGEPELADDVPRLAARMLLRPSSAEKVLSRARDLATLASGRDGGQHG